MTNVTPRLSARRRIVVERRRRDRIETGRRLVEEQDCRIERHGARDAGAFSASRRARRYMPGEGLEADELELHQRDEIDGVVGKVGVHLEQPDVLEQRHRSEERARLIHHASPRWIRSSASSDAVAMSSPPM
jgi:hypothetical protein